MAPTDKCKVPHAFWQTIQHFGVRPEHLLRQARLPLTVHLDRKACVTTDQYFKLLQALEDLSNDPALGIHMVETVDTAIHPPSSLAAFYALNYRDGLTRLARFKRLCSTEELLITETPQDYRVTAQWPFAIEKEPSLCTDITLATLLELGRRGTREHITPRRIELTRTAPVSPHHAHYFGCPIHLGAEHNALILNTADLEKPFSGHNQDMIDILTPPLTAALSALEAENTITEHVTTLLKRNLASGQPSLSDIAQQLGLSDRTLQRRITQAGSTFRDLLSTARHTLSLDLLRDPMTDIDEVACLLGYQDTTSFYRAFREWEGTPPHRWRELNTTTFS